MNTIEAYESGSIVRIKDDIETKVGPGNRDLRGKLTTIVTDMGEPLLVVENGGEKWFLPRSNIQPNEIETFKQTRAGSKIYAERAKDRYIQHLVNELAKINKQKVDKIDEQQRVLENLLRV